MKKVLIAGGTGLVGQRLIELLPRDWQINVLSRSKRADKGNVKYFQWDLKGGKIEEDAVKVDHIINLNGAGIADKRWSDSRKEELINSRVESNVLLGRTLGKTGHRPSTFMGASAIGYYGDRGNEILDERSTKGEGFMVQCCDLWEQSSAQLQKYVSNWSIIRIGVVLSSKDGALPKILMTRNMGVLTYFGDGEQYYSWIHIDDLCHLIKLTMTDSDNYFGLINGVSPQSLSNRDFVHEVKKGWASNAVVIPAPAFALRLAMGEMADVVLNSNRVIPQKLLDINHKFLYADLSQAVQHIKETGV